MTDELKSCAHCGNAEIKPLHECNSNRPLYRVKCYKCGMQTHLDDKDKVIAAWNTRHESDTLPPWTNKVIVNEICNTSQDGIFPNYNDGYINALNWVLTLRKPEETE